MDILQSLLQGFATSLSFSNILAALIGAGLGIVIGAIPGLGSVTGVALLLPLTFQMDPITGIIMLGALYYGCMYGGSYSAILLNIPGDAPAVVTALDGYPLSQKGLAGKALFTANLSSFIGGTVGIIMLTFLGPVLAKVGLLFGPAEIAALILLALCSIGWLLGDNPGKGLISTFLGILLSTIGLGLAFGQPRFTFDSMYLLNGISFIPLVIGMFGFSQVLDMMVNRINTSGLTDKLGLRDSLLDRKEVLRVLPVSLRSGVLGNLVGILPGAGATTGSFLAYVMEKKVGRRGQDLGKGEIEGVAASEAGNNAAAAGSFAPLLSLGIPGSGTSAVLLGGLMMWGLQPGPLLFQQNADFVWGLISSMYLGNVMAVLAALAIIPFLVKLLRVPHAILIPVIAVVCVVGSYSVNNSMFDVWFMLGSGVVAYFMSVAKYPVAPLLLAFVLTPRLETSLRQALDISRGDPMIFFNSPIAVTLLSLILLFVLYPLAKSLFLRSRKKSDA
ncbi:tripartite tricarboxylate transporter permease [Halomonas sp. McH1-25]|uniref:tripartite tricarboxylate transporter permease n=1 Tax=unclassified Halomonas TaxID=2609666 RepID=UPI001EF63C6F|nr:MULTISPECIES: tripartite tricarboxylate transporter permease [unclassified Halomonas]MCG7601090.1 tripartite tricarboxylate transporter permease [Halomonas sp. McH1-25]MCP1342960.1 tripartite tricarboxylate transporter permease [Halomonas sp. FL8]MCP1360812.1 tripartite tricarboxylate transporter permease [Halomonas sp. BBD45]